MSWVSEPLETRSYRYLATCLPPLDPTSVSFYISEAPIYAGKFLQLPASAELGKESRSVSDTPVLAHFVLRASTSGFESEPNDNGINVLYVSACVSGEES